MTEHLYYQDSYLREFTAEVIEQRRKGEKSAAILNRTAFYPTSGGQPHDTGILGSARVLDVEEDESGTILHVTDPVLPCGPVKGRLDWERRFDHMQQHTGQHVLSQAFLQTASAPTLSFHLGQETCTIDIGLAQPVPSVLTETEDLANRVVFEDRPVRILMVDRAELNALGIRKETSREGRIRVIDVEGFDRSACGGTHVRRSGEIGMIAILGCERYKGGSRIEFACGNRALTTLRRDHDALKTLGRLYSAHPYELPRLTEKVFEERAALARENAHLQGKILEMEALDLVNRADKSTGKIVVVTRFSDRTLESLKVLAQKIATRPRAVAILAVVQEAAQVVVAKSNDLPGSCGMAVKEAITRFGGKGGGKSELAQAGGIAPSAIEAWLQSVETFLLGAPTAGNPGNETPAKP